MSVAIVVRALVVRADRHVGECRCSRAGDWSRRDDAVVGDEPAREIEGISDLADIRRRDVHVPGPRAAP